MKQLSILISFLVPLANQLAAEEISLICKTREESTTVLSGEKSKTTDDTRVNSSVSLVIANGVLEDEELLWFPAFDCSGEIRASFSETEIAVNFDNSFAWVYSKDLLYRFMVQDPLMARHNKSNILERNSQNM